jgi:23S rRNA (guanine745-N1)-methyltransferase
MIVARRARLWEAGVGRALLQAVLAAAPATRAETGQGTAVELGSGCGDVLAALCRDRGWRGIGIDLSTAAVDYAARRFPDVAWVAANADRRLPLLDGCADVVLSLNARRNPAECARVLRSDGWLVVAVPAPDDLVELRAAAQGEGRERSRAETLIAEHAAFFDVASRGQVREQSWVPTPILHDLLAATYRSGRARVAARVSELDGLTLTQASELVVFVRREVR